MANSHLAILKKPYIDAILSAQKTIESRFTRTKRAPFGQIAAGDRLFFKASSGPVCALGRVRKVMQFENLNPERIQQLKTRYNKCILGSDGYWAEKLGSRYGVLLWLEDVKPIEPIRINKKDWRAWVILTARENFGLF